MKPTRPLVAQTFSAFSLSVTVTPAVQLSSITQQSNLNALYTTMILSVPVGGNPVVMGNENVLAANNNGLQIAPGVPILLALGNERQLYELQRPLSQDFTCNDFAVPFIVWDTSRIWFAALTATQVMGVTLFSEPFV